MITRFFRVFVFCAVLVWNILTSAAELELVVDVDVNDEVWLREAPMTEANVTTLVAGFHARGAGR